MKRQAFLCCSALIVLAQTARADEPIKVPFDLLATKHMVVMIKLNGKGPYRCIFDTGAPFTLLNNRIAKEAEVTAKGGKGAIGALLGPVPQSTVRTFELGNLKVDDYNVTVMDHPTLSAIDKVLGPVQGIVGMSLFAKYRMTIDYQAKEMTFVPVDFKPPDILQGMLGALTKPKTAKKVLAPAAQWGFIVAKADNDTLAGVDVSSVSPGGPADKAGLKAGDRLLTLEDRWTDSVADCFLAATFVQPGAIANLLVRRDGKELRLKVKVTAGF